MSNGILGLLYLPVSTTRGWQLILNWVILRHLLVPVWMMYGSRWNFFDWRVSPKFVICTPSYVLVPEAFVGSHHVIHNGRWISWGAKGVMLCSNVVFSCYFVQGREPRSIGITRMLHKMVLTQGYCSGIKIECVLHNLKQNWSSS